MLKLAEPLVALTVTVPGLLSLSPNFTESSFSVPSSAPSVGSVSDKVSTPLKPVSTVPWASTACTDTSARTATPLVIAVLAGGWALNTRRVATTSAANCWVAVLPRPSALAFSVTASWSAAAV